MEGRILIHLRNLDGTRKGSLADEGPRVRTSSRLPVVAANLALHKAPWAIRRRGGRCDVAVEHVGLHEVGELMPAMPWGAVGELRRRGAEDCAYGQRV